MIFLQQLLCGYRFPALIHVWIASAGVLEWFISTRGEDLDLSLHSLLEWKNYSKYFWFSYFRGIEWYHIRIHTNQSKVLLSWRAWANSYQFEISGRLHTSPFLSNWNRFRKSKEIYTWKNLYFKAIKTSSYPSTWTYTVTFLPNWLWFWFNRN